MQVWPLKFRRTTGSDLLVADDSGSYFKAHEGFIDRYATDCLTEPDRKFLSERGHAFDERGDLSHTAFLARWAQRQHIGGKHAYIILVPTLRCDLKCSYCQVSRAPLSATGFDWDEETLARVIDLLDALPVDEIQIEFQGGEPLLRLDHLQAISNFARARFQKVSFVVCTNLQNVNHQILNFLASDDVMVSTSLDGPRQIHTRNRTGTPELTEGFRKNLRRVIEHIGQERVSALPTIDMMNPPNPSDLISTYEEFGLTSLYLRPVNYQGFARKSHPTALTSHTWAKYYRDFITTMIQHNANTDASLEEFYLTHCLRRLLAAGHDNHTDLRNPNVPTGANVVIDHDGLIYPSDEARMLARIRQIDLSIGNVSDGIEVEKLALMAPSHINNFDPDCIHCPYQPFCGTDPIDDLSRRGRIDIPRHESWFCQRHLAVFDLAIELLYSRDPAIDQSLCRWLGLETLPDALRPEAP